MYKPTNQMMIAVAELTNYEFREKYNEPLDFHIYLQDYPYSGKEGVFNFVLEDGLIGYPIYKKSFPETNNLILLVYYKDTFLEALKDPFIQYLMGKIKHQAFENTPCAEPCEQEFALLKQMNEENYLKDEDTLFQHIMETFKFYQDLLVTWDYDETNTYIDVTYKDTLIAFYTCRGDYLNKQAVQDFMDYALNEYYNSI